MKASALALQQIQPPAGWPYSVPSAAFGKGRLALEVVLASSTRLPANTELRSAWKKRQDRRGVPLLLVVSHRDHVWICGPAGEEPPVLEQLDPGQVERLCQEALEQPDRTSALRALRDGLDAIGSGSGLPGLRNEGLVATHQLVRGVPERVDWGAAQERARGALGKRGVDLLRALDFGIVRDPGSGLLHVLSAGEQDKAVAILLEEGESPDLGSARIPGHLSPVSFALHTAKQRNLDWVVVLHGRKIRLYPVSVEVGVGRRGTTNTWIECHTSLLPEDRAAYLWLVFSAEALRAGGTLQQILEDSDRFAGSLAEQLRDRIYNEVIPRLAEGLALARGIERPTADDLSVTYRMAMTVLFRLLFIAYGEDQGLLPFATNGLYQKRSLKEKARELLEKEHAGIPLDAGDGLWKEIQMLFRAVERGNADWGVPEYDGGLFSSDEGTQGAELASISLPGTVFGSALQHLLLVDTEDGVRGPVDFRSLGVREFGTIYEGLLESELSRAEQDLTTDEEGNYRPCKRGEQPVVARGKIYLHNASGARKSTGTYYTPSFAVEHLLERALEPALTDHLRRLATLDDDAAAESFFDFRVADIAMGSGHFLIAAVDRIEQRLAAALAERALPRVQAELGRLRTAAQEELKRFGEAPSQYGDIEDSALLRRLIARRCIYGVDLNETAVELARLALWIHTFVPGLPLSLLDRNLVHGDALTGVARFEEFQSELPLFPSEPDLFLAEAKPALGRLAKLADATMGEVREAKKAMQEAAQAVQPVAVLCDLLAAARAEGTERFHEALGVSAEDWQQTKTSLLDSTAHRRARKALRGLKPLHFPVAFPEVFLRLRAGFDVIVGNPPWEKVREEEHAFWARHFPGLRGLTQREREARIPALVKERPDLARLLEEDVSRAQRLRAVLTRGPYPGMGTGDPDLYKAFCWRFWDLVTPDGGRVGVVLPRSALAAKGSGEFRKTVFASASAIEATVISNKGSWFFEEVDPRYTICLIALQRAAVPGPTQVRLRGPYADKIEFDAKHRSAGASFLGEEVASWTDSASLPLLPTDESVEVFSQMRKAPRLDLELPGEWRVRAHAEVHATNDKELFDLVSQSCPDGFWPVYKGESFDLWEPDTGLGHYYAWADPAVVLPHLQKKAMRGCKDARSIFFGRPPDLFRDVSNLPCAQPRIAFRDVTRATDSRTVRCALVPPRVFLSHTAPYLDFMQGRSIDCAYLLGILSSIPLDWYSRRFVETHLTYFVLNPFPIPRPPPDALLRKRVSQLAGRLAALDERYAEWASTISLAYGPLAPAVRQDMIHELDSVVALLYGLTAQQLAHIFETFHEGWDFGPRLEATLRHYRAWKAKV